MAYLTADQLSAMLADAGGAGARTAAELPTGRLEANVAEAADEVVGRLSGIYTLPAPGPEGVENDDTPPLLRTIVAGIAGYLATLEFYGTQEVQERDPVVLRYTRAQRLLDQLAAGTLKVAGITVTEGSAGPTGTAEVFGGVSVGLADGFLADSSGRHNTPWHAGGLVWE